VNDAFSHPLKALKLSLLGPRVTGPLARELPITYSDAPRLSAAIAIPVSQVRRASRETDEHRHEAQPH